VPAIPPFCLMRAWKAVEESSGGSLVDEELVALLEPLWFRNAVHNPNWAWILAGPVAGSDEPVELRAVDVLVVVVAVVLEVELVDDDVDDDDVDDDVDDEDDDWCAAAVVKPCEARLSACDVWPGRDPEAAAAAALIPNAAMVAAATALAVRTLDNMLFLLGASAVGAVDDTIAAPLATTDASCASSLALAGPVDAWISEASPLKPGGASTGMITPDSSRSTEASSIGNRCI
jgi:hypothetical protein